MGIVWVGVRRDEQAARRLIEDPDALDALLEEDDGDDASVLDLDNAWHGVHWLFTGSVDPTPSIASDIVCGGTPFGEDQGYGPPRLLDRHAVAAVADYLNRTRPDEFRSRFDPSIMAREAVYPSIWSEPDILDDYLMPTIDGLRAFYASAAAAGEAVVQILC